MTALGGYSVRRYTPDRGALGRLLARDSPLRRLDWVLIVAGLALSGIGSLLVWSATRGRTTINHGDPQYFLIRHLLNLAIGLGLCVGTVVLGHRRVRGVIPFLYPLSILLLLAVLSPLGSTVNGAHSWIVIGGGFSLQPSEFAKITIILGMAMVLSAQVDAGDRLHPDHRNVGWIVLDACVAARDPHFFPEHGLGAHRPSSLLLFEADEPDLVVEVSAGVEAKLAALLSHRSQWLSTMAISDEDDAEGLDAFRARIVERVAEAGGEAFKVLDL